MPTGPTASVAAASRVVGRCLLRQVGGDHGGAAAGGGDGGGQGVRLGPAVVAVDGDGMAGGGQGEGDGAPEPLGAAGDEGCRLLVHGLLYRAGRGG